MSLDFSTAHEVLRREYHSHILKEMSTPFFGDRDSESFDGWFETPALWRRRKHGDVFPRIVLYPAFEELGDLRRRNRAWRSKWRMRARDAWSVLTGGMPEDGW